MSENINVIETAQQFLENLKKERRILDFAYNPEPKGKKFCHHPFTSVEIHPAGDIYTCCPAFIKNNKIGNLKENTFEEIWFGEKAQELREKISRGDYSMCNLELCGGKKDIYSEDMPVQKLPRYILLSYDKHCNLKCISCRDEKHCMSKEEIEFYNSKIDSFFIPLFKEAEEIALSGLGEALFSPHSKELIKRTAAVNKHVRFRIYSNGLLLNMQTLKELGIYGRINSIKVSVPAMNKYLYEKIMRGNNYDVSIRNIRQAAYEINKYRAAGSLKINSVISVLNYREMPLLADFAKELNAILTFSQYNYWNTEFGRDYKSVSVWDKEHPEYENFKKILKHPALDYDKIAMTPLFKTIRESE